MCYENGNGHDVKNEPPTVRVRCIATNSRVGRDEREERGERTAGSDSSEGKVVPRGSREHDQVAR